LAGFRIRKPAVTICTRPFTWARHALEPDLKSAADSRFIKSGGQHVQLSTSGKLYIDVEEFERVAEAAIKTEKVAACETAINLYRGDLLNEDAYEDWVVPAT
jgi:DNA-binding SARP family transcriptional activator